MSKIQERVEALEAAFEADHKPESSIFFTEALKLLTDEELDKANEYMQLLIAAMKEKGCQEIETSEVEASPEQSSAYETLKRLEAELEAAGTVTPLT
jgi:hypothetical protein